MRQLFLYSITGLYNECHDVDFVALRDAEPPRPGDPHGLRSLNNLWWRRLLAEEEVRDAVRRLNGWVQSEIDHQPAFDAILANPDLFVAEVTAAPHRLVDLGAGPRSAFRALETLKIYTDVHTAVVSRPFELSLQEGYVVNELSSLELARSGLNPSANPYLRFLEEFAFPAIDTQPSDLAWIVGRVKLTTFAMAMRIKQINPQCHISVVGHSSEYYSLNKITKYLRTNGQLFNVVDSVVLDDFDNTPRLLREALEAGDPLESVPNLMYVDRGEIHQTGYLVAERDLEADLRVHASRPEYANLVTPASAVAETRLWPAAQCYWNNCNFCAINRRYNTLPRNSFALEVERAQLMVRLREQGLTHLWSVDEAIPPTNLGILAKELINLGSPLQWETRSKIDRNFSAEICDLLGQSGLREIRLGLESANPRVLASMGKYPDGWSVDLVETIVRRFHNAGVSVHFPTIIGYPGETAEERADTYAFLERLVAAYPSITFNINILGFDVASKLFEEYESFGVTTLSWPVPTKYFLGNLIDWDCAETPFRYDQLDRERNDFMRRVLYPWMPESASIEPYIFYRLTETSRATVVWKTQRFEQGRWREPRLRVDPDAAVTTSPSLVVMGPFRKGRFDPDEHYACYVWSTHHSFECDAFTADVLRLLRQPHGIEAAATSLGVDRDELQPLVDSLASVGAIVAPSAQANGCATFAGPPARWHALPMPASQRRQPAGRPTLVSIERRP